MPSLFITLSRIKSFTLHQISSLNFELILTLAGLHNNIYYIRTARRN